MALIKRIRYEEKHSCFEMTNLRKHESGLPYDIWLDSAGCTRNTQHNVMRIKVSTGDELIPVIINSQRDIRPLRHFKSEREIISCASDNYDTLFKHWNGELSDGQDLYILTKY